MTDHPIGDLARRCREILAWRRRGVYEGTALAARAALIEDGGSALPMREAEDSAVKEALVLCAALDDDQALAEAVVRLEMAEAYDDPDHADARAAMIRVATAAIALTRG